MPAVKLYTDALSEDHAGAVAFDEEMPEQPEPTNAPTLAGHIGKRDRLGLREGLGLFRSVARAVSVLHGRGRAQGNLHPESIMLNGGSEVILSDLGPAEGVGEGGRVEVEKFIAPEVRAGERPDTRSDVYSLGKLLNWILTGRVPNGEGANGSLPEELGRIVSGATCTEPVRRTQTVSALTDALDAFDQEELRRLEDELELATSAAGFDPRLLWKRHPKAVVCCVVVTVICALGGGWLYRQHAEQKRIQARRESERKRRLARERAARERNARAHRFYDKGQYRDAAKEFKNVAAQDAVPQLREQALCFVARSYRQLKDYGAEYGAWMRLLRHYPETAFQGEANQRIARIASLTLKRFGDLVRIDTRRSILVDGLANDWEGIEPIMTDKKGDNVRGGPASDMRAFYAVVSGERLYMRFDTTEAPRRGDQFCVAIDLNALAYEDSSEEWDYQIGVARGIPPWIWDLRGERGYDGSESQRLHGVEFAQKKIVEFSVPLSALGNPCSASLRAFTNYKLQSRPNDMVSRKVLVEWCGEESQTESEAEAQQRPKDSNGK